MRKRLLLLFCLLFFSFGCSYSPIQEDPLSPPSSFSEHYEISIAFWDIQGMENAEEKDAMWKAVEEKFNISIIPVNLNWSDYNERFMIMSVSDTLPDVFASTIISGTPDSNILRLSDLLSRKMIRPVPNDLSSYPNVQETIEKLKSFITYSDGNIYTFPRTSFFDQSLASSDAGILVRKDWMETLGIPEPASLEEFIKMTVAFAKNDPNRNGLDDTIGYNSSNRLALGKWLILGIVPSCNVSTWVDRNSRFLPTFLLPEFENVVLAYHTLYISGGLDPDFYLKKPTDAMYDFAHGRLGALEYKLSPAAIAEIEMYWNQFHDKTERFEDHVSYLPIFPAPDGKRYSNTSSPFWSETLFSSKLKDDEMERVLHLFNYLLSDDGWMLTRFGLEGKDYEIYKGQYQSLMDTHSQSLTASLTASYPSINLFKSLASWGGIEADFAPTEQNILRYGEYATKMADSALQWNKQNTVMVERPEEFVHMLKENSKAFSSSSMIDDFIRVIISDDDPIEEWHRVIQSWYENGLEAHIESLNQQAKQNGILPKSAVPQSNDF